MSAKEDLLARLKDIASSINEVIENLEDNESSDRSEPEITLEQIRGVMASKAQNGYANDLRKIISKYGGKKLSDISKERYPALLKDVEAIGNAS